MGSIVGTLLTSVMRFLNYFFGSIVSPTGQSDTDYLMLKISYLIQANTPSNIAAASTQQGFSWILENIVAIVAAAIAVVAAVASFWQASEGRKEAKEAKKANELAQRAGEIQAIISGDDKFTKLSSIRDNPSPRERLEFFVSVSALFYLFDNGQLPAYMFTIWLHALAIGIGPSLWRDYIKYLKSIDGEDSRAVLFYTDVVTISEDYDSVSNTQVETVLIDAFTTSCNSVRDHVRCWESTNG